MNAVEIEQAISELAEKPFDRQEFPFQFLEAFGNKDTTLKRLRTGVSNKSDLGGVLQTNNIHIATCAPGQTSATIAALRASPATTRGKARFILATMAKRWRQRISPLTTHPLPAPIPISTTISASSCRLQASPPSSRSAKAPLTSRRPAA